MRKRTYGYTQMVLIVLALISGLAFAYYGFETLFAAKPEGEFERYGMQHMRQFVGSMQLLGAAGLGIGLAYSPIGVLAAGGLCLMMVFGLIVRVKIHDAPKLMVPAASLGTINGILAALFILS